MTIDPANGASASWSANKTTPATPKRINVAVNAEMISSAGRSLVLLSGGEKTNPEEVLDKAREAMEAGGDRPHLWPQRLAARTRGVATVR